LSCVVAHFVVVVLCKFSKMYFLIEPLRKRLLRIVNILEPFNPSPDGSGILLCRSSAQKIKRTAGSAPSQKIKKKGQTLKVYP